MDFETAWTELAIDDRVAVSNGQPPPSANQEGIPYKAWKSHNFTGELQEKKTVLGWRYMVFKLDDDDSPDEVDLMCYTVSEGAGHSFVVE
ncbi:MAG: hypothetical protein V4696_03740 [Pseudomonadota bacterium]